MGANEQGTVNSVPCYELSVFFRTDVNGFTVAGQTAQIIADGAGEEVAPGDFLQRNPFCADRFR